MLTALLQNNNNTQPVNTAWKADLASSGGRRRASSDDGQRWPNEIVDIMGAINTFPEISGEHPVTRAARRHKWIGDVLPLIKDAREKREAMAFMAGAVLADAAAEERHAAADAAADAQRELMSKLKIEQLVEIIDSVRGAPVAAAVPPPRAVARGERGASGGGGGLFLGGLIVGGLLVGMALSRRQTGRRSR